MEAIKTDLSALNNKQTEAVISEDKRLLVLAGAVSGKTKTLLQKIISQHPQISKNSDVSQFRFPKGSANVFIFNFFPVTEEVFDEFDEILDRREDRDLPEDLKYEVNSEDQLFLKKYGIRF